jgi:hypothetical protein
LTHVQNTSITIHETDIKVQRGFPSRLSDSSFKTHKKLTTFILGLNHLAHQSVTVLQPALRIDCVVFGTFSSSGTTQRKTNFPVQSFIFGLQCTLDFFCKMPTCSKKFHTCFNNNALFVRVSNIKLNHVRQEKACLKMLSCTDNECSLWSVCIWLVHIIFLLAQCILTIPWKIIVVMLQLNWEHRICTESNVHTHYFFACKNLCQKYPT